MRWVLSLVLGLLFVSSAQALKNSEPALSEFYRANVFVVGDDVEGGGSNDLVSAYCNGTLVTDQWMVTAAHCVKGNYVLKKNSINVQVGEYKYKKNKEGNTVRIGYLQAVQSFTPQVKIFFLPSVKNSLDRSQMRGDVGVETDIALVYFIEPLALPENFPFAPLATIAEVKAHLGNADGKSIVASINPFEEMSTDTKRFGYPRSMSKSAMGAYLTATAGTRVDPGDSGAPLFIFANGQWKLGGVVKGMAKNIFSDWDVYPMAGQNLCQIAQSVAQGTDIFCR